MKSQNAAGSTRGPCFIPVTGFGFKTRVNAGKRMGSRMKKMGLLLPAQGRTHGAINTRCSSSKHLPCRTDKVPIAFFGVKLQSKASQISHEIRSAAFRRDN